MVIGRSLIVWRCVCAASLVCTDDELLSGTSLDCVFRLFLDLNGFVLTRVAWFQITGDDQAVPVHAARRDLCLPQGDPCLFHSG